MWSCSVTCPSWNPCKSTREELPSSFVEEAFRRGSVDNISVLVLDLCRAGSAGAGEAEKGEARASAR